MDFASKLSRFEGVLLGESVCCWSVVCCVESCLCLVLLHHASSLGDKPMVDAAVPFQRGWGNDFPLQ